MGTMNISVSDGLLSKVDRVIAARGYSSRSEFIRDAIRILLREIEWASSVEGNVLGVIVTTYDTERRGISDEIIKMQHGYEDVIMTTLHNHLHDRCMEIILAKGGVKRVRELTENLRVIRGMESVRTNLIRAPG
jgi:CopG family nickel-responsive transcriptional regulator